MSKIMETRIAICRYGDEESVLKDLSNFGWSLANKKLLNRFGNPLPANERVSESDLREKCSYELSLVRRIDEELVIELNSLQNEYEKLVFIDTSFGGGKITASVFLTIAFIVFLSLALSRVVGSDAGVISLLIFAFLALGGIVAINVSGGIKVANRIKHNEEVAKMRKSLLDQAKQLLKGQK